ncbi:vWA domain-containing protein [Effusibacillus dendaii]|uniref:VWFA domain-containing protein n=1 Tax=Effusibacillus dendaii TaxID=2743772 RepID=A0A7I8DB34_9BACL|nr:hypothetical protein [Effusibacillus dendaii]BCJ87393.1 hypothetical protein skT53_23780 [Effusibacillus dendaii]
MWEQVELKQILLLTDGCSNLGGNPVEVAKAASHAGIAVNVIGILDGGSLGEKGRNEVQAIAAAGNGMSQFVETKHLGQTMQMLTRHTMQATLQQAMKKELKSMIGRDMEQLPPERRIDLLHMIDRAGELSALRLVLLIDVSASMRDKLPHVREAIRELEISLEARKGEHKIAVITFPAGGQASKLLSHFCKNPGLSELGSGLSVGGSTPTGPALYDAIRLLQNGEGASDVAASSYVV